MTNPDCFFWYRIRKMGPEWMLESSTKPTVFYKEYKYLKWTIEVIEKLGYVNADTCGVSTQ